MSTMSLLVLALTQLPSGQASYTPPGTVNLAARPVDMVVSKDGSRLYLKTNGPLIVANAADGHVLTRVPVSGGASLFGLALSLDGKEIYYTDASSTLHIGRIAGDNVSWRATVKMPAPMVGGDSYPCGVAVLPDGTLAVALSRSNSVAFVDPVTARVIREVRVDVAPYGVAVTPDGKQLLVSCWSIQPKAGYATYKASGTPVPIRPEGNGVAGSLVFVDPVQGIVGKRVLLGLQPTEIAVAKDGTAYVGCGNGDKVAVVDTKRGRVVRTIDTRPKADMPFGSAPNGVSLSKDESRLYVSIGGANAVAVYARASGQERLVHVEKTSWYPGVARETGKQLFVGAIKGDGRGPVPAGTNKHNSHQHNGQLLRFPLSQVTRPQSTPWTAIKDETQHIMAFQQRGTGRTKTPVPIPAQVGERSVFDHVVYVIKENRTYDQVLGDMPQGDGDPNLVMYGRTVTPNQHSLAEQFVLLDNFYCNGVLSADGHAWATEGNATSYFERSFGGWTRSYPFGGDDPLSVSATGFLWDSLLAKGKTLRNYGEFDYAESVPGSRSWTDIWNDFQAGKTQHFTRSMSVPRMVANACPEYPGWNLKIPDVLRASVFMKDFEAIKKSGKMANLSIVYLPQNHTSGLGQGSPTPRAMVADNDLALGQIVDAISHSKFWAKTCIFVIEDDPQDGFDHVDGHRSPCYVISPYTKRRAVVRSFFNQTSVLHSILQIFGAKPTTRFIAGSPLMSACFVSKPDLTPFKHLDNVIPLDEMNPKKSALKGPAIRWAAASARQNFARPDLADEGTLNRILWFAAHGNERYPSAFEGAHGKGLAKKGLRLTGDDD